MTAASSGGPCSQTERSDVDMAKALGLGKTVDLDDPATGHGEPDNRHGPSPQDDDRAGSAIDEDGVGLHPGPSTKLRPRARLLGHGHRAPQKERATGATKTPIGPQDDLGVEHGHQAVDIAPAGGVEEGG